MGSESWVVAAKLNGADGRWTKNGGSDRERSGPFFDSKRAGGFERPM